MNRGALHHLMLRGIERGNIVYDDEDRGDFLTRMGNQAQATGFRVHAWALMDNHGHPASQRRIRPAGVHASLFDRLCRDIQPTPRPLLPYVSKSVQIHCLRKGKNIHTFLAPSPLVPSDCLSLKYK
jgi:hypothetical protein